MGVLSRRLCQSGQSTAGKRRCSGEREDIQIIKSAQSLVRIEDEHSLADDFENSTQVRRLPEPARPCQVRAAEEDEQTLDCEQRLRAGEVEGLDCDGEACGSEPCDAADKGKQKEAVNKRACREKEETYVKETSGGWQRRYTR